MSQGEERVKSLSKQGLEALDFYRKRIGHKGIALGRWIIGYEPHKGDSCLFESYRSKPSTNTSPHSYATASSISTLFSKRGSLPQFKKAVAKTFPVSVANGIGGQEVDVEGIGIVHTFQLQKVITRRKSR